MSDSPLCSESGYPTDLAPRNKNSLTEWQRILLNQVEALGGFYNAHTHLDRAHTLAPRFLAPIGIAPLEASILPLSAKQNMVFNLHDGPAYTEEDLRARMTYAIERQIALGVTRIDTNIDATPDLPKDGLLAIYVAIELRDKFAKRGIRIRIAPTPIGGFKPDLRRKRTRWEVFEEAARKCDYLSLLPEKDDPWEDGGKIGFKQHIRKGIELARMLGKQAQFHLDQMNSPYECGTEWLLDVLDVLDRETHHGEPMVSIIHGISLSAKSESYKRRIMDRCLEHNVEFIVCPSAALSMLQLSPLEGPVHNSIAPVSELIKMGITVKVGTDNIDDVFVPQGDGDMLIEVKEGSEAVRLNSPSIWAKLATGTMPNKVDISTVGTMLYQKQRACEKIKSDWKSSTELN